jgi:hypothetical protein
MSQKFGTFSTIEISEELPCEIIPAQGRKTGPFSADEESFFEAGYAMMTANDAPDSFADLAPQPAASTSTKGLIGQARAMAVVVPALWSKVRGALARTSVTVAALVAALWSKVPGSLARTSVTLAALVAALWSKVPGSLARTSVTLAALVAALWSKVRGSLVRTSVTLAALVPALWSKVRGSLVRTSVTLAALVPALWSKVRGSLARTGVTLAPLGLFAGHVRRVITRGISSLVRHFETRWRRHRAGGIVLCKSHGTVRRGRHNTLLGYPVLSRRL